MAGAVLKHWGSQANLPARARQLVDALAPQRYLVLLDNCEHLVDPCAKLADVVRRSCRSVHLLATSREPLGTDGEPSTGSGRCHSPPRRHYVEALSGSEAVELFFERARSQDASLVVDDHVAGVVVVYLPQARRCPVRGRARRRPALFNVAR